ncbi:MAG TPA: chalcone isomerase family protein [Moraxellaceae bacterium]|nr:chalcone isomerase family protein [Moraxellaceae bacterium]
MRMFMLLLALWAVPAHAGWQQDIGPATLRGTGRFCFIGFCLYDAELWSARDPLNYDAPFALVLTYRHAFARERLADSGIDEIRRLATHPVTENTLARWRSDMLQAFIDVRPGDSLCGIYLPGRGARFYANGRLTVQVDDPEFARAFFDIWLNPDTRAASLRRQLLGLR